MDTLEIKDLREAAMLMQEFGLTHLDAMGIKMERPAQEKIIPPDAPSTKSDPIQHKLEEMRSILAGTDLELVDRLFPLPKDEDGLDYDMPPGAQ